LLHVVHVFKSFLSEADRVNLADYIPKGSTIFSTSMFCPVYSWKRIH